MKNSPRRSRFAGVVCALLLAVACPTVALEGNSGPPAASEAKPPSGPIIPKPSAPDPRPFTLEDRYFDAARRGDLAMLKTCLDKGVDVGIKDELQRSALALAVRDGRDLEMVEFLAARGLAVDDADATGRAPIHEAAANADPAMVSWLLKRGVKLDRKDMQGRMPLHNAVYAGSKEVVVLLLTAGADVNARDNFQDTPLIGACNKGLNELARLLVEKGADPSLKDQEGRTAAERAEETAPFCRSLGAAKPAI